MNSNWIRAHWDRAHEMYKAFLHRQYIERGDLDYQYKYAMEEHRHFEYEYRNVFGWDNNQENYEWGNSYQQLLRFGDSDYLADGFTPAMIRPSSREISNEIFTQVDPHPNPSGASDMFWLWGQFIDHDIDLTPTHVEAYNIQVPTGDIYFDPNSTGSVLIPFDRSDYDHNTGTSDVPREQINMITSYLDGSVIYGSDQQRADFLRTFEGGQLKTSDGNFLPFNDGSQDNAGGNGTNLFVAGDIRANEHVGLTAMHTLFVREHNYWAKEIAGRFHQLSDEEIYQRAKVIVEAEIQKITYTEFLPLLLGPDAIPEYDGYHPDVNPQIANIFSTAAFRLGHTLLSSEIVRLNEDGSVIEEGNLALRDAFFSPSLITDEGGISPILRGFAAGHAESIDAKMIDEVRNFLFGEPGSGGFDLAALNIQRGRDHGLPDFNSARVAYGLTPINSFDELTDDQNLQNTLENLYGDVNNIDVFVGGLIESPVDGSMLGELFHTIVADQFARIRDGDRFWYEERLSDDMLDIINDTSLSDIIVRNTDVNIIQDQVMLYFDRLEGTNGSDTLIGTENNDLLIGLNGSDLLIGNGGDDQLIGGLGADIFKIGLEDGQDTISDFRPGLDKIDLSEHHFSSDQLEAILSEEDGGVLFGFSSDQSVFVENISLGELSLNNDVIL